MYCKKCGSKLRDDAIFCLECGTQIKSITNTDMHNINKIEKTSNKKKVLIPVLGCVALVLVVAVTIVFNKGKETGEPVETTEIKEQESTVEAESNIEETENIVQESETGELKNEEKQEDILVKETNEIHTYELLTADVTWQEAYDDCIARGGYLVHINSKEEFDTIVQQIKQEEKTKYTFWLGANRIEDSYHWVYADGSRGTEVLNDSVHEEYWLQNEPSLTGADAEGNQVSEEYVDMLYRSSEDRFYWNDVPNDIIGVASYLSGKVAYICEYEE